MRETAVECDGVPIDDDHSPRDGPATVFPARTAAELCLGGEDGRQCRSCEETDSGGEGQGTGGTGSPETDEATVSGSEDNVPYDRGWAWIIVLSGFVNLFIAAGYNRATYMFFVHFLEEFRAPVSETALLFGIKDAVDSVVGLFIMNAVLDKLGVRKTVLLGGLCLALSAVLGSLATDITSLILAQSVFHGLAMSMLNMPITVLLGFYFRRRRSLANALTKCGVGVGAVALPPVVTFLLQEYGLRGAMLLMGGFCLQSLLAAMLLRPVSFYRRSRGRGRAQGDAEQVLLGDGRPPDSGCAPCPGTGPTTNGQCHLSKLSPASTQKTEANKNHHATVLPNGQIKNKVPQSLDPNPNVDKMSDVDEFPNRIFQHSISVTEERTLHKAVLLANEAARSAPMRSTPDLFLTRSPLSPRGDRPRTLSEAAQRNTVNGAAGQACSSRRSLIDHISGSSLLHYLSQPDLSLHPPCPPDTEKAARLHRLDTQTGVRRPCPPSGRTDTRRGRCVRTCRLLLVLDLSLFRSPLFRLLTLFFLTSPMIHTVAVYLPAMAKERGLNEGQRALLLSIMGALDFVSRLGTGVLADLQILKMSSIMCVSSVVLGVSCHLVSLYTTFPTLLIFCVLNGLLCGVAPSLVSILIMDDIGLQQTAKAFGFYKLFSGAAMAAFHPLLGYIRDTTGSYDVAYHVIGAFTILSGIIIFITRFFPHQVPNSVHSQLALAELSPLTTNSQPTKLVSGICV